MLNGSRPIIIGSNFSIPLKLTPSFDVGIFSYFYKMQNDSEKLFQPDVALSIDGTLLKPKDGTYAIRPGIMKIKYCGQVYTIVALRSGV
ncbi:hypothetical protein SBF1_50007 [Candidatus Desulfosporosinus infrequens]|uniref:Uncharacterized protein n=1 Tax=Candidatus Desulfosporosinus infrequens TaxID=2043169 RepID=A0A2U3LGU8_9FIRM|nr:hypothetical protein SBF1_50007 [Candidatus Desulfosporosinus infrequens]